MTPPGARLTALSVAAPAYNEAAGIARFVESWLEHPHTRGLDGFELVVCDDGSTDGTGEILATLAARHPSLRVVTHARNRGAGAAMATAIAATRLDWVLLDDADGQFPPDNLRSLAAALESNEARALLGTRKDKQDAPFARMGWRLSTLACNVVYQTSYADFSSACQLVEGPLVRALPLDARGLNYSLDVVAKLIERGIFPVEVPIEHLPRATGRSSRTLIRSSVERAAYVGYLAVRRTLQRRGVLAAMR